MLDSMNSRDLSKEHWVAMMIDSVYLGEHAVVTCLGLTAKGKKVILGIREGITESSEVVKDLLSSLCDRGFKIERKILFVIDGGKALRSGIMKFFGKGHPIQRCGVHKLRNIQKYLDKRFHGELKRRWKLIHESVEYAEAEKHYKSLELWLSELNYEARRSLEESNKETLTVIKLKTDELLRKTLWSTNPIESVFSKVKDKSMRVKNWKSGTDQVLRWSAAILLNAEEKFRTVKGHKDIPNFIKALKELDLQKALEVA